MLVNINDCEPCNVEFYRDAGGILVCRIYWIEDKYTSLVPIDFIAKRHGQCWACFTSGYDFYDNEGCSWTELNVRSRRTLFDITAHTPWAVCHISDKSPENIEFEIWCDEVCNI